MKTLFFALAATTLLFTACNVNNKANQNKAGNEPESQSTITPQASRANVIGGVVDAYLQLKNALTHDDGNGAANAGKLMFTAMEKVDKSAFSAEQKKLYEDVADDAKEHAEHIGKNAADIAHQREHFDMLSKDMYDLVKAFGPGKVLYKDHCPVYNGGKGAIWLSEAKEIRNPYQGKKMPECGSVEEELK